MYNKIKTLLFSKKLRTTIIIIVLIYFISKIITGFIAFNIIFKFKKKEIDYKKEINKLAEEIDKYYRVDDNLSSFILEKYDKIKQIKIKSYDNIQLNGYIIENDEINENNNWVIISHAYKEQILLLNIAYILVLYKFYNLGFNILIIDHRAHGSSEGKYLTLGYKERFDIKEWIKYISNKYPNSNIATYGLSMGATSILLACGEELPKNFKICIADSAFNSCYDVMNSFSTKLLHIPSFVSNFILGGTYLIGKIFYNFDINFKTENFLKKSKHPILFIHGDSDYIINVEIIKEMYKNYTGEKEILIINNADHCLGCFIKPKLYWETIKNFTRKYMNFDTFDKKTSISI